MPDASQPSQEPDLPPLPEPPALPFTVRASLKEYRQRLGVWRFVLAALITLFILLRFGVIAWIGSVVLIALIIGIILFILSHRKLIVTPTGLELNNAFGRRIIVPYNEVARVRVFAQYVQFSFGITPYMVISTTKGRPFVSLTSLLWNRDDLDPLVASLYGKGFPVEYYEGLATSAIIARQFPDAVKPYERHPVLFGLLISLGIVVIVVVGVLLFAGPWR